MYPVEPHHHKEKVNFISNVNIVCEGSQIVSAIKVIVEIV